MDKPDSSELEKVIDEQMESAYFVGKNCIGFPEEVKARIKRKIIALMPDKKEIRKDERKLRDLLWAGHVCNGKYGDDGEIQCGRFLPVIDFLRDTPEEIERKIPLHYAERAKALKGDK